MKKISEVCAYADSLLQVASVPDYPNALNGLQLENEGRLTRLAAAVDASESTIEKAIAAGAQLLVVHHGLYWQGLRPITGPMYRKLKKAMDANLAIYSVHLPLDAYGDFSNSVLMARDIGLEDLSPFNEYKGIYTGVQGEWSGSRESLVEALNTSLGGSVHVSGFGPEDRVGRVAIVSGGAGSELEQVSAAGISTFISGEGAHWTVPMAEELGMNLIYGGHYATETFGVKALTEHLSRKYDLPWVFIDNPTGL